MGHIHGFKQNLSLLLWLMESTVYDAGGGNLGLGRMRNPVAPPYTMLLMLSYTSREKDTEYRIAEIFGGELNLAVWRFASTTTKLNISYDDTVLNCENLNPPICTDCRQSAKFNSRQIFRLYSTSC